MLFKNPREEILKLRSVIGKFNYSNTEKTLQYAGVFFLEVLNFPLNEATIILEFMSGSWVLK